MRGEFVVRVIQKSVTATTSAPAVRSAIRIRTSARVGQELEVSGAIAAGLATGDCRRSTTVSPDVYVRDACAVLLLIYVNKLDSILQFTFFCLVDFSPHV